MSCGSVDDDPETKKAPFSHPVASLDTLTSFPLEPT